jgi:hypothetical protein
MGCLGLLGLFPWKWFELRHTIRFSKFRQDVCQDIVKKLKGNDEMVWGISIKNIKTREKEKGM